MGTVSAGGFIQKVMKEAGLQEHVLSLTAVYNSVSVLSRACGCPSILKGNILPCILRSQLILKLQNHFISMRKLSAVVLQHE